MGASVYHVRRAFTAWTLLLLISVALRGQADLAGHITERVNCEAEPEQAYALYLPSNYTAEKRWPVIFCFDASARGRMPVERLQSAAEKYGYIVVGSLNSKNGPWAANAAAIRAMGRDVSAHFSIDPHRVYTAGVSGGARVATAVALSGTAKGVIACAAGFPGSDSGVPAKVPFVFFGTTGTEDFNHAEMWRLDEALEQRKAVHRIVEFDGGHSWAPAEIMAEAVEWLELQAMRAGTRARDEEFIRVQLEKRVSALPLQETLARWRALKSLTADFDGVIDVASYAGEAARLGNSREVIVAKKAEATLSAREDELVTRLGEAAEASRSSKERLSRELRAKADAPENSPERQMVRRAIASFVSMARETSTGLFENNEYEKAAGLLEMASVLRPQEMRLQWDLARAYSFQHDEKRTLAALRLAIANGFNDVKRAETEPAFASMRERAGFKEVVATITADPAEAVQLPVMRISAAMGSIEVRLFYLPNAGGEVSSLSFLRVESVVPHSAGAKAGVEVGMEITAIQGTRIRGLTQQDLDELLARPVKNEVVLTVRGSHQTDEKTVRLPLRGGSSAAEPKA